MERRYKQHRVEKVGEINNLSGDMKRAIMDFCAPGRYLTVGLVNREFNSLYRANEKMTSTLGFLESNTPLEYDKDNDSPPGDGIMSALRSHRRFHDLIPSALNLGIKWDHFCVEDEAFRGNKNFFYWLSKSNLFWLPENAYASAAEANDIHMMDLLMSLGLGFPDSRCRIISTRTINKDLSDWIRRVEGTDGFILSEAVKSDDLTVVMDKFSVDTSYEWILQDAVRTGSVSVVNFLLRQGLIPCERDLNAAEEMYRVEIHCILREWFSEFAGGCDW